LHNYTDCWYANLSGGLNVGFNVTNRESKPRRMRKPDWTEEQCLAQLMDEHKDIIKGKFGPGVNL